MRKRFTKTKRYLQDYHIDYLKENAENLSIKQLAQATGFTETTIGAWCKQLKLKTRKSYFQFRPPVIPVCEPYE